MDGVSVDYPDWHFNVRASNTEPLLRLNLEAASAGDDGTAARRGARADSRMISAGCARIATSTGGRLASASHRRGSSSAVERELPKLDVAGSIPVSRSKPSDDSFGSWKAPQIANRQVGASRIGEFAQASERCPPRHVKCQVPRYPRSPWRNRSSRERPDAPQTDAQIASILASRASRRWDRIHRDHRRLGSSRSPLNYSRPLERSLTNRLIRRRSRASAVEPASRRVPIGAAMRTKSTRR